MRKLPTFSTWPSNNAKPDFRSCLSFVSFVAFFSASEADLRIAFCRSKCSEMRVKSQPLKDLIVCDAPSAFEKSSLCGTDAVATWTRYVHETRQLSCDHDDDIDAS